MSTRAISLQSGLREYNGDLSAFTGMRGGLTPDIHTLKAISPETTNRVLICMFRGPYFMQTYFAKGNNYAINNEFATYKKMIEYFNVGIAPNIGESQLNTTALQGGIAGRTIPIPTTQAQTTQQLVVTVPELVGRPITTFHNMWIDGIADPITGLTTYHGNVAGSVDDVLGPQKVFAPSTGAGLDSTALEPSPAWEIAEFLLIALDRSGARPEGAIAAIGCTPSNKIGRELFNMNATGSSELLKLQLAFNCQYVEGSYINDLASRYVKQFAVFGNSMNYNPGAGDAFFANATKSAQIDSAFFNGGVRPTLDSVQSELGNAPVFSADQNPIKRDAIDPKVLTPADHSRIYNGNNTTTPMGNPYGNSAAGATNS
jgi:hypothetical protein